MINRRTFLGRGSAAIVSTMVALNLPMDWVPKPVKTQAGLDYLKTYQMEFYKIHNRMPLSLVVGSDLYDSVLRKSDYAQNGYTWNGSTYLQTTEVFRSQFPGWKVVLAS